MTDNVKNLIINYSQIISCVAGTAGDRCGLLAWARKGRPEPEHPPGPARGGQWSL